MSFDTSALREIALTYKKAADVATAKAAQYTHAGEHGAAETQDARAGRFTRYRAAILEAARELDKKAPAPPADDELGLTSMVNGLFGRRRTTPWAEGELRALRQIRKLGLFTQENFDVLATYYAVERQKGEEGRHRRDLGTFLNNFTGELDRARAFKASPPKSDPRKQVIAPDPSRWKRYCTERGFPATPFDGAPQHWKDGFTKWEVENGF